MKNNILEVLESVIRGTKLYSPYYGELIFIRIKNGLIYCKMDHGFYDVPPFDGNGRLLLEFKGGSVKTATAECMLFPSKEVRTWDEEYFKDSQGTFEVDDLVKIDSLDNNEIFIVRSVIGNRVWVRNLRRPYEHIEYPISELIISEYSVRVKQNKNKEK